MLTSVDITATQEYNLKKDSSEPKTVFLLGLFDSFIASKIQSAIWAKSKQVDTQYETDLTDIIFEVVRYGLRGVKNFSIPFQTEEIDIPKVGKRTVASNDFMKHLKIDWIMELYGELLTMNFAKEEEKKT